MHAATKVIMQDLTPMLQPLVDIARRAGDAILAVYHTDFAVQAKDDDSPLTAADEAAHAVIAAALAELTPDIPVLSEESARLPWTVRQRWDRHWLVDPLDGTKEFIKRNGEFTVNIALIEAGRPVIGVVHAPVPGTTWSAAARVGAFRQDGAGEARPIHTRRPPASPLRVVASRSHRGEALDAWLAALGAHEIVSVGSSLKFCVVAEGGADVYPRLGPTMEWDTAAGQCVAECAGATVTDASGAPLSYGRRDSLLNPYFIVRGDAAHPLPPLPGA
jgi:3'(2'), 5'-bisphosphate nucleotidase